MCIFPSLLLSIYGYFYETTNHATFNSWLISKTILVLIRFPAQDYEPKVVNVFSQTSFLHAKIGWRRIFSYICIFRTRCSRELRRAHRSPSHFVATHLLGRGQRSDPPMNKDREAGDATRARNPQDSIPSGESKMGIMAFHGILYQSAPYLRTQVKILHYLGNQAEDQGRVT